MREGVRLATEAELRQFQAREFQLEAVLGHTQVSHVKACNIERP